GIAEVNARSTTTGAVAFDGTGLDVHAVLLEMRDHLGDRPVPDEAEIAVAELDRQPGDIVRRHEPRSMHVQLRVRDSEGDTARVDWNDLGADDVTIERRRFLSVGDRDHTMIEPRRRH